MNEKKFSRDGILNFRWLNRTNRRRRSHTPYTTRTHVHIDVYRAKRKRRNKAALVSRKINR